MYGVRRDKRFSFKSANSYFCRGAGESLLKEMNIDHRTPNIEC